MDSHRLKTAKIITTEHVYQIVDTQQCGELAISPLDSLEAETFIAPGISLTGQKAQMAVDGGSLSTRHKRLNASLDIFYILQCLLQLIYGIIKF